MNKQFGSCLEKRTTQTWACLAITDFQMAIISGISLTTIDCFTTREITFSFLIMKCWFSLLYKALDLTQHPTYLTSQSLFLTLRIQILTITLIR